MNFHIGNKVKVKYGNSYIHTKTGSEGIVKEINGNRIEVEFYKLTGEEHPTPVIFSIIKTDLIKIGGKKTKKTKKTISVKCEECGEEISKSSDNTHEHEGDFYCQDCWDDNFTYCNDCGDPMRRNQGYETDPGDLICEECYGDHYFTCEGCGGIFHEDDYGSEGLCRSCCKEREHETSAPDNKRYVEKKSIYRDIPVGVEIEAEGGDYGKVEGILSDEGFGICEDGSLENGIEVQIPASNNGNNEKLIHKACKILNQNGFRISDRCGLHIHLGYPSRLKAIKNLLLLAYVCEPVFYAVNPKSREDNRYCYPVRRSFKLKNILEAKLDDIDKLFYYSKYGQLNKKQLKELKKQKYNDCRYYGFNLHSYFFRGTVEFRYHSGTTEPQKILKWIALLKKILIYAKYNFNQDKVLAVEKSKSAPERIDKLFRLIRLPKDLRLYFGKRYEKFR